MNPSLHASTAGQQDRHQQPKADNFMTRFMMTCLAKKELPSCSNGHTLGTGNLDRASCQQDGKIWAGKQALFLQVHTMSDTQAS